MEDKAVQGFMKAKDPDNDLLTFEISRYPYKGELQLLNAGKFNYIPNSNENDSDTFTFTVNDGRKTSIPATVTLTIYPVNDSPLAKPLVCFPTLNLSFTKKLPFFDPDIQDIHSIHFVDYPKKGQIFSNQDQFSYIASEAGVDLFTYQVSDGHLNSNIASVLLLTGSYGQEIKLNPDKNNDGLVDMKDLIVGLEQFIHIKNTGETPALEDIVFILGFVAGVY